MGLRGRRCLFEVMETTVLVRMEARIRKRVTGVWVNPEVVTIFGGVGVLLKVVLVWAGSFGGWILVGVDGNFLMEVGGADAGVSPAEPYCP